MELWVPRWPPQPQGRPTASSKAADRGLRRDGYHRPVPHSSHHGERLYQWQDIRGSPQPQDPRADHQVPHYVSRLGEEHQPMAGADYGEGGYPSRLYSRRGIEDPYQSFYSSNLREEYAYRNYYYPEPPQQQQEEGALRQGSPYIWHEDYHDQKYLNEHHHENQNSSFGTNSETQCQSKNWNPYKDSPASNSGQERPGELFPESLLTRTQKNKPTLTDEPSLLWQHESGLSSSSYELSQYLADAPELYDPMSPAAWSPVQAGGSWSAPKSWSNLVGRGLGGKSLGKSPLLCIAKSGLLSTLFAYVGPLGREANFGSISHLLLCWKLHHS